jgi:hypothetical protein
MTRQLLALLLLACIAAPARAAELQLTIEDGKVTLDARDVTLRQILTEWARVGKTRMVNIERLAGGPLTMKFDAIPEKQALDILLRAIPGYMAAPRETFMAGASLYETILVMPTTTAVAAVRTPERFGTPAGAPFGMPPTSPASAAPPPAPAPDAQDPPDAADDPAIATAAAAGLLPVGARAGDSDHADRADVVASQTQPATTSPAPGTTPAPTIRGTRQPMRLSRACRHRLPSLRRPCDRPPAADR